jgi:hypothetical protein
MTSDLCSQRNRKKKERVCQQENEFNFRPHSFWILLPYSFGDGGRVVLGGGTQSILMMKIVTPPKDTNRLSPLLSSYFKMEEREVETWRSVPGGVQLLFFELAARMDRQSGSLFLDSHGIGRRDQTRDTARYLSISLGGTQGNEKSSVWSLGLESPLLPFPFH